MNQPLTTTPNAASYFNVLAKPTGAICNLDCKYCFFLSKEMLAQVQTLPRSGWDLTKDEKLVEQRAIKRA